MAETLKVTVTYLAENLYSLINKLEEGKLDQIHVVDGQAKTSGGSQVIRSTTFAQSDDLVAKLVRWDDFEGFDPTGFAHVDSAPITNYQYQAGTWGREEIYQTVRRLRVNDDTGTAGVQFGSEVLAGDTSPDGDIQYTSVVGATGVTVEHVVDGAGAVSRSIDVTGSAITVNVATSGANTVANTETAEAIAAAVNADADASALVNAAAQGDGTGLVAAQGATSIDDTVDTSPEGEPQVIGLKRTANDDSPRAALVSGTLASALSL